MNGMENEEEKMEKNTEKNKKGILQKLRRLIVRTT
jgi:hypothetical protein